MCRPSRPFARSASHRFAILWLRHTHLKVVSIVEGFSLCSTADEVGLHAFCDQFEEIIHNEKSYKFVAVDFKARLGEAQEEEYRMRKFGMGQERERKPPK
ncbi:unnamed protein product [Haemonchus placei]|uniref:AP2/ERF domain-containing protein n=1 Tax=Haemonchus placei TaxID=6290 RepID=A0A0N4X325_HAEPC|nr:unnamed protein product [Haemonchus placei]